MAHPYLNALLNDLLPFAGRMLRKHSEFYPFGGSIPPDGRHVSVGAKGSSDHPNSQELIDIMTNEFRSQASDGKIRAADICFDVRVVPPGQVDKTDAIQFALEREGGDALDVFVPYAQLPDASSPTATCSHHSGRQQSLRSSLKRPNQSLDSTADRRVSSLVANSTFNFVAEGALISGGSALSR